MAHLSRSKPSSSDRDWRRWVRTYPTSPVRALRRRSEPLVATSTRWRSSGSRCMMGDGNMYWMEALHDLGVELLEVRHEGAGLGMADGWARVRYSPGVCTATC